MLNCFRTNGFGSSICILIFLIVLIPSTPNISFALLINQDLITNYPIVANSIRCPPGTDDEISCNPSGNCFGPADEPIPCPGTDPDPLPCRDEAVGIGRCSPDPCNDPTAICPQPPPVKASLINNDDFANQSFMPVVSHGQNKN